MCDKRLTSEQVIRIMQNIGETGQAKLIVTELHTQQEKDCLWRYHGQVEDWDEAQRIIDEFFNPISHPSQNLSCFI